MLLVTCPEIRVQSHKIVEKLRARSLKRHSEVINRERLAASKDSEVAFFCERSTAFTAVDYLGMYMYSH